MDEELSLLSAYTQRGDEAAFAEVVRRRMPLVYGLAFRELRDHQFAEEVCQNVFSALASTARRKTTVRSMGAWLYKVTRRQTAQVLRTEASRRRREQAAVESEVVAPAGDPDEWNQWVPELTAALAELSENDQRVLFLRFYEGNTFKEVASCLGIRERAAQKRTARAIDRLRAGLARRGLSISAGLVGAPIFTAGAVAPPASVTPAGIAALAMKNAPSTVSLGWPVVQRLFGSVQVAAPVAVVAVASVATLSWAIHRQGNAGMESASGAVAASTLEGTLPGLRGGDAENLLSSRGLAIDAIEAIYALPRDAREPRLQRLVVHLESQEDRGYLANLFQRWTALDPRRNAEEAVALFRANKDDADRAALFGEILAIPVSAWYSADEKEALAWVKTLARTDYAEAYAFEAILGVMAERNVEEAYTWLIGRPYNRDRAFEILAGALNREGVERALEWLGNLQEPEEVLYHSNLEGNPTLRREADRPSSGLFTAVIPLLYERDRGAVCDWLVKQPSSRPVADVIEQVCRLWAAEAPGEAAEWALSLQHHEEQRSAVTGVMQAWAGIQPEEALSWALSVPQEALRWHAADTGFRIWLATDKPVLESASTFLEPIAQQEGASRLFAALGDRLPLTEGPSWVETLPENANRSAAVEHVCYRLGQATPEEGIQWLMRSSSGQDQFIGTRALSTGWLVSGGRASLEAWKAQLDAGSAHYYGVMAAEASVIGAFDPELVREQILGLPEHPRRDAVVVSLIERVMYRSTEAANQALEWTRHLRQADLRQTTRQRIQLALEQHEQRPPGTVLPDVERSPLQAQPLDDLELQLAALATMPRPSNR